MVGGYSSEMAFHEEVKTNVCTFGNREEMAERLLLSY